MQRHVRFLVGVVLGGGTLAGYLHVVGTERVLDRAVGVAPWALAAVLALVVLEGLADAVGTWASIEPLGEGLSPAQAVQFALAGDFFDVLSPAGPASSEPIMARFIGVTTGTGYSDALGVRATAKFVKSGAQLAISLALGTLVVLDAPQATHLLLTLGGAAVGLLAFGVAILWFRGHVSTVLVAVLAPVVARVSGLYRERPHDRSAVAGAVERFWGRIVDFRGTPGLLALIAVGGALEQVLTAAALWVALAGTGTGVALLPLLVVVPLPQVASVVPVPGSIGAYDVLLAGALAVVTGAPAAATAAAVLVVRTFALPFGLAAGGVSVAFLRGWRPGETGG